MALTTGFENREATHRGASLPRKTDRQNAVRGLKTYLQSGPADARKWLYDKALATFQEVRRIYKAGDKSAEKVILAQTRRKIHSVEHPRDLQ